MGRLSQSPKVLLIGTAVVTAIIAGGATAALAGSSTIRNTPSTKQSPIVVKKTLGKLGVNLRVLNLGPRNIRVVICHPGACKPEKTLRPNEVEDMSASEVSGHFSYQGRIGSVRFTGVHPDIGKPKLSVYAYGPSYGPVVWALSEGERTGCQSVDGGEVFGARDSDISDYKRLVLKVSSQACRR